jgi:hypothetical protein
MPVTPKGIYYPGSKFPAQLIEDMSALGSNALAHIDGAGEFQSSGPTTLTAPTVYTSTPGLGDAVNISQTQTSSGSSENLLMIHFMAQWKKSVTNTMNAAIFINGNQLKTPVNNNVPVIQEAADATAFAAPGFYNALFTDRFGLTSSGGGTVDTGFSPSAQGIVLPMPVIVWGIAPGGSSVIEIKYKATTGNIILGQRWLWVRTVKGA